MRRLFLNLFTLPLLLCGAFSCCPGSSTAPEVLFGGELHNSNASTPASIDASFDLAVSLGYNAVLAPVSWDCFEISPGRFDYTLVDCLLKAADRRGLYLGLLWFGSWKNGESSYPPLWIRKDTEKYFRAADAEGNPTTSISPFCKAALEADISAFSALMAHIRKADTHRRVFAVQVENECGAFLERDFSPAGQAAWEEGGWQDSTDIYAPQYFMAEAFAKYVDAVAAAGKAEYDIPMFTNAWLMPADAPYGKYPNGGPRPLVLDVWKRHAPHLDWLSPDIYATDFRKYCSIYGEGQTLFIPETRCDAGKCFYALGEAKAKGVFGFGYEEHYDNPYYVQECRVISELMPLLGKGLPSRGFVRLSKLDAPDQEFELGIGDYIFKVHCIEGEKNAHGIIIQTADDEFIVLGVGAWIDFSAQGASNCKLASCEEFYSGEVWQVLNGDETGHHNMLYLRGRLYLKDSEAPDGTIIEAPMYGLSYQRRFIKRSQQRFKVSGIYRIKLYKY